MRTKSDRVEKALWDELSAGEMVELAGAGILSGRYARGGLSFDPLPDFVPNRLQLERLRRQGVPPEFLTAVGEC